MRGENNVPYILSLLSISPNIIEMVYVMDDTMLRGSRGNIAQDYSRPWNQVAEETKQEKTKHGNCLHCTAPTVGLLNEDSNSEASFKGQGRRSETREINQVTKVASDLTQKISLVLDAGTAPSRY